MAYKKCEKERIVAGGFPIEIIPATLLSSIALIAFWAPWVEIFGKSASGYEIAKFANVNLIYLVPIFCMVIFFANVLLDLDKISVCNLKKITFAGFLLVAMVSTYMWFELQHVISQTSNLAGYAIGTQSFEGLFNTAINQAINFTFGFYLEVGALVGVVVSVSKMRNN